MPNVASVGKGYVTGEHKTYMRRKAITIHNFTPINQSKLIPGKLQLNISPFFINIFIVILDIDFWSAINLLKHGTGCNSIPGEDFDSWFP